MEATTIVTATPIIVMIILINIYLTFFSLIEGACPLMSILFPSMRRYSYLVCSTQCNPVHYL